MSELETFFINNWWVFVLVTCVMITFKWWLTWVDKQRRLAIKKVKESTKNDSVYKEDINTYIMQPELTIQALNKKREILERQKPNNYQRELESIDNQIKWLQTAQKIPPIARKPVASIGNVLMNKAEKWISDL